MLLFIGLFIILISFLILVLNTPRLMLFIIILGALLVWDRVYAKDKDHKADLIGVGIASCTDFANDYKKNPALTDLVYYSWFTGFMTGMNSALGSSERPELVRNVAAKSGDTMKRDLRQYCNDHPLSDYAHAALSVMSDLPILNEDRVPPLTKFK